MGETGLSTTIFNRRGGVAEEVHGGESGQFPFGLAKCFVFALFLLGLQFQAVTAFIRKKGTQIKSPTESRKNKQTHATCIELTNAGKSRLPCDHRAHVFQEGTSAITSLIIST